MTCMPASSPFCRMLQLPPRLHFTSLPPPCCARLIVRISYRCVPVAYTLRHARTPAFAFLAAFSGDVKLRTCEARLAHLDVGAYASLPASCEKCGFVPVHAPPPCWQGRLPPPVTYLLYCMPCGKEILLPSAAPEPCLLLPSGIRLVLPSPIPLQHTLDALAHRPLDTPTRGAPLFRGRKEHAFSRRSVGTAAPGVTASSCFTTAVQTPCLPVQRPGSPTAARAAWWRNPRAVAATAATTLPHYPSGTTCRHHPLLRRTRGRHSLGHATCAVSTLTAV